jgi:uncharacterized membrane protein YbaN (DUF454 family)
LIKRTFYFFIGLCLVIIGIIGAIIPVMPGWTPLILGVILIHPPSGHRLKKWAKKKNEQFKKRFKKSA